MQALDTDDAPPLPPFWRMALINSISSLTVPLASLVDAAALGRLESPEPLAAVALSSLIFDYMLWLPHSLRTTTTALVAGATGRGSLRETAHHVRDARRIAYTLGLAIVVFAYPLLLGAQTALNPAAELEGAFVRYYAFRLPGTPFAILNYVWLGWLLGRGSAKAALWLTILGNLVNVVLDIVLIFGLELAEAGAGAATACGQLSICAAGFVLWRRSRAAQVQLPASGFREALRQLRPVITLQRDVVLRTFLLMSAFALFVRAAGSHSTERLALADLWLHYFALIAFVTDGTAHALETYAGQYVAQRNYKELVQLLHRALRAMSVVALCLTVPIVLVPRHILRLLTDQAALVAQAPADAYYMALVVLAGAPAWALDGLFFGIGAGATMRRVMTVSFAIFCAVASVGWLRHSFAWLWLALAALMLARSVGMGLAWRQWRRAHGV